MWGTNLTISSVTQRIRRFFMNFKAGGQAEDDDAKYIGLIRQVPGSDKVLTIFFSLQRQNWEGGKSSGCTCLRAKEWKIRTTVQEEWRLTTCEPWTPLYAASVTASHLLTPHWPPLA